MSLVDRVHAMRHELVTMTPWDYALLVGVAMVGYVLSQVIYNLYFHPNAHFPGPFWARVTRLWYVVESCRGTIPFTILKLHQKYGRIVRIAPDELSISEPAAWKQIYGHRAGKGEVPKDKVFYSSIASLQESIIVSPGSRHGDIRRLMSYGFSEKALREQEGLIQRYCALFMERLEGLRVADKEIDMVKWYNFFTFDVIGDLAFGESFKCLEDSFYHPWVALMFSNLKASTFLRVVSYYPMVQKLTRWMIPRQLVRDRARHRAMSEEMALKRLHMRTDRIDFMTRLTNPEVVSETEFIASTGTLVIAGSETTATLLSGVTYYLLMNPDAMKKVVDEVRSAFTSQQEITFQGISKLSYLLACLEEALRIYPPVPGSFPRCTAAEEEFFDGKHIPKDTTVSVYHWSAYHNPEHFYLPESYIPERFLGDPRFDNDHKDILQPFSFGPRNCLGKNLAIMEMRLVMARLLFTYDLELVKGYENWIDQKTYLLWEKHPLMIKLFPRKQ